MGWPFFVLYIFLFFYLNHFFYFDKRDEVEKAKGKDNRNVKTKNNKITISGRSLRSPRSRSNNSCLKDKKLESYS